MAQITLNSSGVASSGSLLLQTNGTTTQATVDTSGNLGLGVTPSAWSGFKALQIGTGGALSNPNSLTRVDLSANWYYNGTNDIYIGTGAASLYRQNGGQHIWYYAASGTAGNTISFTEAMRIDASGNFQLGATSSLLGGSSLREIAINNGTASILTLGVSAATTAFFYTNATNTNFGTYTSIPLTFHTANTERARIDSSGNLLVGTTSTVGSANKGLQLGKSTNGGLISIASSTTSGTDMIYFYNPNNIVGAVGTTGSSTYYNTSSDYRLKENIHPMTGALARISALKPCTYTWKADGSNGEGFIAHELAEVVPQCVTGAKDAVDENGNPKYQGIDTSFLVATLTAALQEAHGLIKDLQTRVAALES